ncbi:hypothetical protein [Ectopseudomonas toyotomiensis]|uniref:Uncharacterized protein n=1 Tax=Ectopseudomonas toyotomiensis TaxID=554344 RepID=A0A1I5N613_9GAMM|nr:hypothetical protein [Pseudomonas toyotomiensis]SFP17355.1 hypothetical protein SAMN05216177_101521 [Pseudomonas toyotomiensis]
MVKVKKQRHPRVSQGDIIRDVEHVEYVTTKGGIVEISKITFPLVVVLTQDCDLAQDYKFRWSKALTPNQDKLLLSVLVAPLYNIEHVYTGEHLQDLGLKMAPINKSKSPGTYLRNNETPRYHYLDFPTETPLTPSAVDFKHYFSVNVEYLKKHKKENFVCQLSDLFREDVSQRFSSFLSRIGLP